eukprot:760223-Pyramimonas_sp.AAC.1
MPETFLPVLQLAMEGAPKFNRHVSAIPTSAHYCNARADLWATAQGSTRMAQPRAGTPPGPPASNSTFNYIFAEVTRHTSEDM